MNPLEERIYARGVATYSGNLFIYTVPEGTITSTRPQGKHDLGSSCS